MENNNLNVIALCVKCGTEVVIDMSLEQFVELSKPNRVRKIQEILPDVRPDIREMLISGFCPKCWDEVTVNLG